MEDHSSLVDQGQSPLQVLFASEVQKFEVEHLYNKNEHNNLLNFYYIQAMIIIPGCL